MTILSFSLVLTYNRSIYVEERKERSSSNLPQVVELATQVGINSGKEISLKQHRLYYCRPNTDEANTSMHIWASDWPEGVYKIVYHTEFQQFKAIADTLGIIVLQQPVN